MSSNLDTVTHPQGTWFPKASELDRQWWVIDASGQRIGRIATKIADLLRGKHKPTFTPHLDNGDFVIVINTDKMELTGNKWDTKKFYRHSRFFGSMKEKTAAEKKEEDSCFLIEDAVKGMLPDNRMSYAFMKKLKTFKGAEHDHSAQRPQPFKIDSKKV
jgi:large subunit ribosomal protein L13